MDSHAITLDQFSFHSQDKRLSLLVSPSLSLAAPHGLASVPTASSLHDLLTSGDLWVGRSGGCRFNISTMIDTEDITVFDADDVLLCLADSIETSKVFLQL
jgi:hypothetical protein